MRRDGEGAQPSWVLERNGLDRGGLDRGGLDRGGLDGDGMDGDGLRGCYGMSKNIERDVIIPTKLF